MGGGFRVVPSSLGLQIRAEGAYRAPSRTRQKCKRQTHGARATTGGYAGTILLVE